MHCLRSHEWQLSNSEEKYQKKVYAILVFSLLYYTMKSGVNTSGIACYAIYKPATKRKKKVALCNTARIFVLTYF